MGESFDSEVCGDNFEDDGGVNGMGGMMGETTMEEEEMNARDYAETRPFVLFIWNGIASLTVFGRSLISLDSVLSVLMSCGLTYFYYEHTVRRS